MLQVGEPFIGCGSGEREKLCPALKTYVNRAWQRIGSTDQHAMKMDEHVTRRVSGGGINP